MYEADGIKLKRSEYMELLHVVGYGKEGRRTFTPSQGVQECEHLCELGLIDFRYESGGAGIDEAWVTDTGRKWLASRSASVAEARKRYALDAAVSFGVALAVSVIANCVAHL